MSTHDGGTHAIGAVVTAMVTPFTADGDLDLDGARRLARHLVDTGTDTVLVNGTTGESPTLHGEAQWELLAAVKQEVGTDGTVMVGTGSNDTARTVANTARAADAGADAVLLVTPYYNKPQQNGLVAHFRAAAEATHLPVLLYDVPGRTVASPSVATLADLAGVANVIGVKDATGDLGKAADVRVATQGAPGGFDVWSGSDDVNLPLLALGAVGVVSVTAHLAGPEIAEMVRVFPTDPARALELHLRCQPLHRALFIEASPAPLKGALNALGLPAGPVHGPLADASAETVKAVLGAYEAIEALR
ncbi:MAG TPA: 4-hydroxy-tetrahydrodipicolinate synthase [Egicoccus sp.]|nr:4-hydroxy-tetrahydrodipicolinate synthase [Egicoccus sp.]HSK22628.1 4-hydroxy-tetrahydrodipicolinate synthase [Egicoccus sp.]